MIVTIEDLRSHLALTDGVAEEDAGLLDIYLRGAEALIEAGLGFSVHERWPDTADIPAALQVAVLQLAAFWFENREAATPRTLTAAPFSVRAIVDAYRDRSF